MAVRKILLLGDEALYRFARPVNEDELPRARQVVTDLQDTMMNFREKYRFGRAIAAPQIGEPLRIIYMNLAGQPFAFINPRLEFGEGQFELWDDCMSFPGLEVRLKRYRQCQLFYKDLDWQDGCLIMGDDLAELIQHEYDHLDGILAVQRAIDDRAFRINKDKAGCY
jgi:peptide deformylase